MPRTSDAQSHHAARLLPVGSGSALRISVQDDGPGFTDTQAVLQLHVRMDEKVPGNGVGLSVVNDLVASHEGTLALGASAWGGARSTSCSLNP